MIVDKDIQQEIVGSDFLVSEHSVLRSHFAHIQMDPFPICHVFPDVEAVLIRAALLTWTPPITSPTVTDDLQQDICIHVLKNEHFTRWGFHQDHRMGSLKEGHIKRIRLRSRTEKEADRNCEDRYRTDPEVMRPLHLSHCAMTMIFPLLMGSQANTTKDIHTFPTILNDSNTLSVDFKRGFASAPRKVQRYSMNVPFVKENPSSRGFCPPGDLLGATKNALPSPSGVFSR